MPALQYPKIYQLYKNLYLVRLNQKRKIDKRFPATHQSLSSTTMDDVSTSFEALQKYHYFRILVIGRANAGKTTLLKRVCNTTDEPCIYDEKSNSLVRFIA